MPRNPCYIAQDRHGVYHFRARVPEAIREHFNGKAEIKRTLRTDSRREALKAARAYRVELDRLFDKLMDKAKKKKPVTLRLDYITILHSPHWTQAPRNRLPERPRPGTGGSRKGPRGATAER